MRLSVRNKKKLSVKLIAIIISIFITAACISDTGICAAGAGRWVYDDGWKYEKSSGDTRQYLTDQWAEIEGKWYFFYDDSTMASHCYIGGYWMDDDGSWSYPYIASWREDAWGWWYGDDNGWYAYDQWLQIDGDYYHFDSYGYVETNKYIGSSFVNSEGKWVESPSVSDIWNMSDYDLSSYFDNTVVVGDSVCEGFEIYCNSSSDPVAQKFTFMANVSFGIHNALMIGGNGTNPMYQGSRSQIWDSLYQSGASQVIISMGINDVGYDDTAAKYEELTDRIVQYCPGIKIVLCSITGVKQGAERTYFTNAQVNSHNAGIKALCERKGYGYIDLNTAVSDGYGLKAEYCSDGFVHQNSSAYAQWLEAFKNYARTELAKSAVND